MGRQGRQDEGPEDVGAAPREIGRAAAYGRGQVASLIQFFVSELDLTADDRLYLIWFVGWWVKGNLYDGTFPEQPIPEWLFQHWIKSAPSELAREKLRRLAEETPDGYVIGFRVAPGARRLAIPRAIQQAVYERDRGRCVKCGADESLEYDHLYPWARGGRETVANLRLLCRPCNQAKGDTVEGE